MPCGRTKFKLPGDPIPPVHYELFENLPAPTLTVAEANKRKPSEMPLAVENVKRRRRARARAYARQNTRAGTAGSGSP
jgi:hypothetical protein